MKTQHTPGPWYVFAMGNYFGINSGSDSGQEPQDRSIVVYGDADDDGMGVRGDTYEEMKANARLIAAAPELLEALQSVIRHGLTESDGYETTLKQIYSAIAKATGQND